MNAGRVPDHLSRQACAVAVAALAEVGIPAEATERSTRTHLLIDGRAKLELRHRAINIARQAVGYEPVSFEQWLAWRAEDRAAA